MTNLLSPTRFTAHWPTDRPTAHDVAALEHAIAAYEALLVALRQKAWAFDFVATVSHADHVAEEAAVLSQLKDALAEARSGVGDYK